MELRSEVEVDIYWAWPDRTTGSLKMFEVNIIQLARYKFRNVSPAFARIIACDCRWCFSEYLLNPKL